MHSAGRYKYFDLIMAAFVTVLLCSNLIGVHKVSYVNVPVIGEYIFGTGVLFFPLSYLFGDILTEVYGYTRSRRVIWAGFGALIFASFMSWVVTSLPPASITSASPRCMIRRASPIECPEEAHAVVWEVEGPHKP